VLRFLASEVPLYTRNPKSIIHENPTHRNLNNKNNERSWASSSTPGLPQEGMQLGGETKLRVVLLQHLLTTGFSTGLREHIPCKP
jgi:hypothetical protein